MRFTKKNVTAAMVAEARRQYEDTDVPIVMIARMLGVAECTFCRWRKDWGLPLRSQRKRPDPQKRDPDPVDPVASLALRVQDTVERELLAVERILATLGPLPQDVTQAERAARTLASLSRTLREVTKLAAQTPDKTQDDDAAPRDIGELRDLVSRRLAKLVADAKAAHPDEREGA